MQATDKAKFAYVIEFNNIGEIIDQGEERNGIKWYRTNSDGVMEGHELQMLNNAKELADCIIKINAYFPPSAIQSARAYLMEAFEKSINEHRDKYPKIDISLPYREGEKESEQTKAVLFSALNIINKNARGK